MGEPTNETFLDGKVTQWCGDVRTCLAQLPSDHFDCVVTSPPYWGLRDYHVSGQIGLEPTLGEHLIVMVEVFREIRRVLKPTGTVWLNYGDCYATAPNGRSAADTKVVGSDDRAFRDKPFSTIGAVYDPEGGGERGHNKGNSGGGRVSGRVVAGRSPNRGNQGSDGVRRNISGWSRHRNLGDGGYLKPKDLCMIPNRLAIALQDDGWWVRSEIIWGKANPMPESVTDRPSCAHEKIFLLTKSPRYFYDATAVRSPIKGSSKARLTQPNILSQAGGAKDPKEGPRSIKTALNNQALHMNIRNARRQAGINERWDEREAAGLNADTRNLRNYELAELEVWPMAPEPFPDSHFATFPTELAERCIKAGTSEAGCCAQCGKPWERITNAEFVLQTDVSEARGIKGADGQKPMAAGSGWNGFPRGSTQRQTLGWSPTCQCSVATVPARVLDPFGGAGTVALVAAALGRHATLIELSPDYCRMARARIEAAFMGKDEGAYHKVKASGRTTSPGPLFDSLVKPVVPVVPNPATHVDNGDTVP